MHVVNTETLSKIPDRMRLIKPGGTHMVFIIVVIVIGFAGVIGN